MSESEQVDEILATWRKRRASGESADPGDVIREHPELAEQLRERFVAMGDEVLHSAAISGPASDPPSSTAALLDRISRGRPVYTRKGEIARGGMGAILRVRDESLRRDLAMKVILEGEGRVSPDSPLVHRFLEEAQVTAQLDHPGVVPVHELGVDEEGRLFFTMKLVKGRTLADVFDLVNKCAADWNRTRAIQVFVRICETLAFAHSKGVIHRDLKPANVMVGEFGEVYVMDWGLAKPVGAGVDPLPSVPHRSLVVTERAQEVRTADSPHQTRAGDILGTPCYMPIEQVSGQPVDGRSDVYAIGAMLYQLLTGHAPYDSPDERRTIRHVVYALMAGPPAPIMTRAQGLPAEIVAITEKAMTRNAAERYQTVAEFGDDLRHFLEGRVVRAYRTGPLVELRKWVRRNRAFSAVAAAAILLLVVGLLVSTSLYAEARDERETARRQTEEKGRALSEAETARAQAHAEATRADRKAEEARLERIEADRRLTILARLMAGYHQDLGDNLRERWSGAFLIGMQDALDEGDPADVFFFLEHARVDQLLGLLGSRDSLTETGVPSALRLPEDAARRAVHEAQARAVAARRAGDVGALREARSAEDSALERLQVATLQAQRLAQAVAAVVPALPKSLEALRLALRPDQAYVAYAVLPDRILGFVVTTDAARIVDLGPPQTLDAAMAEMDAAWATQDLAPAIDLLRTRLVDPLRVPSEARQVLLSPEGRLLRVPFGLLLPDREIACVPSATTWLLLQEAPADTGTEVLAVGDPDYSASRDAHPFRRPLPAARREAEAIGSRTLLGKDATLSRFREALECEERWRGVHLACSSFVDESRPLLSALLLAVDDKSDGYLRALDIVGLRVNADLVSLGACETAHGFIRQGGGIGSLTRAFLYAGARRVLVSMTKVDDQATEALITRFYELWNPPDRRTRPGTSVISQRDFAE